MSRRITSDRTSAHFLFHSLQLQLIHQLKNMSLSLGIMTWSKGLAHGWFGLLIWTVTVSVDVLCFLQKSFYVFIGVCNIALILTILLLCPESVETTACSILSVCHFRYCVPFSLMFCWSSAAVVEFILILLVKSSSAGDPFRMSSLRRWIQFRSIFQCDHALVVMHHVDCQHLQSIVSYMICWLCVLLIVCSVYSVEFVKFCFYHCWLWNWLRCIFIPHFILVMPFRFSLFCQVDMLFTVGFMYVMWLFLFFCPSCFVSIHLSSSVYFVGQH